MSSRFSKLVALVAAVHLLGGHWAILQVVAWAGMVVTYSQEGTFISAVEKTFDGEHPCHACKVVKTAKDNEVKSAGQKIVLKWDAVLAPALVKHHREVVEVAYPNRLFAAPWRVSAPLLPPPLA